MNESLKYKKKAFVKNKDSTLKTQVPFVYKLVLNQWLLSLYNVKRFEDLAEHLCNEALEGLDENNVPQSHTGSDPTHPREKGNVGC